MMHHSQGHHHLHDAAGTMDYRRFSVDNNQLHHHHHHSRTCTCKLCWPLNPYSTPSRTISPLPEHLMKTDCSCSHHITNTNPTPLRPGFCHGVDKSEGGFHASAGRSPSFSVAADCFVSPRHHSEHTFYHHSDHGYVPRTPNTNEFNVGFNLQREPKLFSPVMFDKSREIIQENSVLASMMTGHNESIPPPNQVTLYNWYLIRCSTDTEVAVGGYLNPGTVRTEKMETSAIVERLQKCQLLTKDSLEVHLMGLIDDYTTVQNGFSIEIIHSFLSGFPYTWNHLLNNEFRAFNTKNSVCPGHSLCAMEATQEKNIPTPSSKMAEGTDCNGVEDDKNVAEDAPSAEKNLEVTQVGTEHVDPDDPGAEPSSHVVVSEKQVYTTPAMAYTSNDVDLDNTYEEELDCNKDHGKSEKSLNVHGDPLPEAHLTVAPPEKSNRVGIGESSKTVKNARASTRITRSMQRLGKHLDFEKEQPSADGEILSPGEPRTPISPKILSNKKNDSVKSSRSITRSSKKDFRGSVNADDSPSVAMQSNVEDVKSAVKNVTESRNGSKDEHLSSQADQNASNVEIVKVEQPSESFVQSLLSKENEKHEISGSEMTPFDFENAPRKKDEDGDTVTEVPAEISLKEDDCNSKTPERLFSMKEFPVGMTSKSASLSGRQVEETSLTKDEAMSVNEMELSTTVDQIDAGELESMVETVEEDPKLSSSAKTNHKRISRTKEIRETGKAKTPRRRPTEVETPDSSRKINASSNGVDEIREVKEESTILKASKLPPPLPRPRVSVSKELVSEAFGLKTSRSGRILVPPLAHWCGQSLLRDKDGGIIAISDGSSDGKSVAGGDYKFKPPAEAELKKLQKRLQEAAIECSAKKKSRKQ